METGTDKIKEKIKRKMSLNDIDLSSNQSDGNLDFHKSVHPSNQPSGWTASETNDINQSGSSGIGKSNSSDYLQNNEFVEKTSLQPSSSQYIEEKNTQLRESSPASTRLARLNRKFPEAKVSYKMTFVLTEEIYHAFNDIYANRLLDGNKTEKSELICEAIRLLVKNESRYNKR